VLSFAVLFHLIGTAVFVVVGVWFSIAIIFFVEFCTYVFLHPFLAFMCLHGVYRPYSVPPCSCLVLNVMPPKRKKKRWPPAWITPHWVPTPSADESPYKRKRMLFLRVFSFYLFTVVSIVLYFTFLWLC
jgi:hypothetical protein